MTINLNTNELIELVSQKMQDMGLVGNYKVTFNKRNQNQIDTSIEIVTESIDNTATEQPDSEQATEFDDSLIK